MFKAVPRRSSEIILKEFHEHLGRFPENDAELTGLLGEMLKYHIPNAKSFALSNGRSSGSVADIVSSIMWITSINESARLSKTLRSASKANAGTQHIALKFLAGFFQVVFLNKNPNGEVIRQNPERPTKEFVVLTRYTSAMIKLFEKYPSELFIHAD